MKKIIPLHARSKSTEKRRRLILVDSLLALMPVLIVVVSYPKRAFYLGSSYPKKKFVSKLVLRGSRKILRYYLKKV